MADQPDQQLLTSLQRGDRRAIEYLIGRYERQLYNFALRFLGDADAAADIVQHVFIQLFTHCQELRADDNLRPWLFRVARHRCLDELRRQRATTFSQLGFESDGGESAALDQIADETPLPDDLAERADVQQLLVAAIHSLPPKYREVVTLRYVNDLTFTEIGQVLGIPEATAKTHFHRAKPLLRAFLRSKGITHAME